MFVQAVGVVNARSRDGALDVEYVWRLSAYAQPTTGIAFSAGEHRARLAQNVWENGPIPHTLLRSL